MNKEINNDGASVCSKLSVAIRNLFASGKTLYLAYSDLIVFNAFFDLADQVVTSTQRNPGVNSKIIQVDRIDEKFNFIVGDLAFSGEKVAYEGDGIIVKSRKNWITILKSLHKLNDDGCGLFLVEPVIDTEEWRLFIQKLN